MTSVGSRVWANRAVRSPGSPSGSRRVMTTAVTVGSDPTGSVGAGEGRAGARVMRPVGGTGRGPGSHRALLQLATLPLGQTAPDAEALIVGQRVLQALGADLA